MKSILLKAALFTIFVGVAHGAGIHQGIVNYWDFDGNLNDSSAALTGNQSTVIDNGVFAGANGTAGIGFGAGLFGSGIAQDGAVGVSENNGFVQVARSADTLFGSTNNLTISMWLETPGFDTNWQTALSHGEGSQYRIARRGADDVISYTGGSGDIPGSAIGPIIPGGTWHHVLAISEAGVGTQLWVDGALIQTGGIPIIDDDGNGNPTNPDLFIGANPQTGVNNREWNGGIDDVGMWNRVLSPDEVALIYSSGQAGTSLGRIPEPTFSLLAGLAGLCFLRRRR